MALNVVLVVATVTVSYLLGHFIALHQARRRGVPAPGLFDYAAHQQLWQSGLQGYRRDPWYWVIFAVVIAIVELLTKKTSFGVGLAVAVAFGFVAGWGYREIRHRRPNSRV